MNRIALLIVALLVCTFFVTANAEQNLILNNGIAGAGVGPRAAVNTSNGDILVTWLGADEELTKIVVWTRLLQRNPNGSYTMKAPVSLTTTKGFAGLADVIYVPWKNQYFVFWDTNRLEGLVATKILGRRVKSTGKPLGGVLTIVNDGRSNIFPRAAVTEDVTAFGGNNKKKIVIVYTALPVEKGDKNAGLKILTLANNMKAKGSAKVLHGIKIKDDAQKGSDAGPDSYDLDTLKSLVIANQVAATGETFAISFTEDMFSDDDSNPNNVFSRWISVSAINFTKKTSRSKMFSNQRHHGTVLLADPRNPGTFHALQGNAATGSWDLLTFKSKFKTNLANKLNTAYSQKKNFASGSAKGFYDPESFDFGLARLESNYAARSVSVAANANTPIARWIYTDSNAVHAQDITTLNNGKLAFKQSQKLFNYQDTLAYLSAVSIPGTNEIAVVWQHSIEEDASEVRVHIF